MVKMNFFGKHQLDISLGNDLTDIVFLVEVGPENMFKLFFTNRTFLQTTGFENKEVAGAEISSLFKAAEAVLLRKKLMECAFSKSSLSFTHTGCAYLCKDFWLTQLSPLVNKQDKVEQILCISKNITVLENRRKYFERNNVLLNRLFEIFPVPVLITNEEGTVVKWNNHAQKLFGAEKQEDCFKINVQQAPGLAKSCCWPDYTLIPLSQHISCRALFKKTTILNDVLKAKFKGAGIVWLSVSSVYLKLPGYGVATSYNDITTQKKNTEKLAASKNILQAILNSLPDTMLLLDNELKVVLYNKAAEINIEKFEGKKLKTGSCIKELKLVNEYKAEVLQHLNHVRDNGKVVFEHKLVYQDKQELWFRKSYYPALDKKGKYAGCVIISSNITDHKTRELCIKKHNEQLMEIAKIQKEELTTPLATVLGIIKLLTAKSSLNKELLLNLMESARELENVIKNKTGMAEIV